MKPESRVLPLIAPAQKPGRGEFGLFFRLSKNAAFVFTFHSFFAERGVKCHKANRNWAVTDADKPAET